MTVGIHYCKGFGEVAQAAFDFSKNISLLRKISHLHGSIPLMLLPAPAA